MEKKKKTFVNMRALIQPYYTQLTTDHRECKTIRIYGLN
jgi:hypothetical protein